MEKLKALAIVGVLTVVGAVSTPAQNLIANGNFTANASGFVGNNGILGVPNPTSITSWTAGAGVIGLNGPATSAGSPYAPLNGDGGYTFAFSSWGSASSGLSQTLSGDYAPNTQYELSFDAAGFRWAPTPSFQVRIGDNTQTHVTTGNLDSNPLTSFTHFSYTFTSPATFDGPCVIKLLNLDPAGTAVDFANVSLVPVMPKLTPLYGFYFTAYPGVGCYATNVNGFANIAYLQWITPDDADQIIACNSKLLLDTTWVFYNGNPGLNPNYQAVWNSYKAQLTPYYISQITAFYVMDEPYLHGLTPAELQTAVACIKADFPNIPVAVTFAQPSVISFNSSSWIPTNLNWISVDHYGDFSAIPGLVSTLETYKQPNQKIFLTPQGWRNGDTDATVAAWSYDYHDLYLSDPEIMGQLVFLCPGAREYVFPTDGAMPLTYAVQQTIGTEVLKMGNSFKRAFSDMFESATQWATNWTSVGSWARATTPVRAGTYSAKVTGPVTDSALTSRAIGVSDAKKVSVNFWWLMHGLDSGEYVRCDLKLDNGAWVQKATLDGGGASDTWLHVIASDLDVSGATNLYVRFRGTMSSITEYVSVDSVNVCKWADPTVTTWPTAATITTGQTLAASTLSGGSATPGGSFDWAVPLTVPPLGVSTQSVIYTPTDTGNYNRIRGSVTVSVSAPSSEPNLIVNGDFMANAADFIGNNGILGGGNPATITSWTAAAGVNIGLNGPGTSAGSPYQPLLGDGGNTFAFISWGSASGLSSLSQTLTNTYTPNTQYELSFDVAQFRWAPSTAFRVSISDNTQTHVTTGNLNSTPLESFTHFIYTFTAPATFSGPCVIKLLNLDTAAAAGVDFANLALRSAGVAPVTLHIAPSGANLQLTWSNGTLLEANAATGPWTTNSATSPYLVAPTGNNKFYRVQLQ